MCTLSYEAIQKNKEYFINLLAKLDIDITPILEYLDSVNYFEKPASPQNYRSYAGGLCEHALYTYSEMCDLSNFYFPGRYPEKEIIEVALFKDIYKAELYEAYPKNIKNETNGNWETVLGYRVREDRDCFGSNGFSSYMIMKKFINFTDEQVEAICWNNYSSKEFAQFQADLSKIIKKYPLVALTHMADTAANYFD